MCSEKCEHFSNIAINNRNEAREPFVNETKLHNGSYERT